MEHQHPLAWWPISSLLYNGLAEGFLSVRCHTARPFPPSVADVHSPRRQKPHLQARHVTRGGTPLGAAWLQCLICAASNEDEFVRAAREVPAALKRRKAPVQPAAQMRRGPKAAKSPNPGRQKNPGGKCRAVYEPL